MFNPRRLSRAFASLSSSGNKLSVSVLKVVIVQVFVECLGTALGRRRTGVRH
jgi:hypothetical protein